MTRRGPKPDPASKRSRGVNRHLKPRVVFHLPQQLLDVIDAEAQAVGRPRSVELVRALTSYYASIGRISSSMALVQTPGPSS